LSVDLACADYRAIGVALLTPPATAAPTARWEARLLDVPLTGRPAVEPLVAWLRRVAAEHGVSVLCIDGPLGWKAPDTDAPHCRLSERAVRAPGKTGLPPDGVKPRTYLAFTTFSIAVFEQLTMLHGWHLPGQDAPLERDGAGLVTESFPTAAWRALGLTPLIAKSRASDADVADAIDRLSEAVPLALPARCTHDQLQAIVGGIAGISLLTHGPTSVRLAGNPPFRLDGSWREGYIMVPA